MRVLGHPSFASAPSALWFVGAVGIALFVMALVAQNHAVAGRPFRIDPRAVKGRLRVVAAVGVVTCLAAFSLPFGEAQSAGALLPDLISDPPRPSFFSELNTADGQTRLVVTFDGYVHNIGEGALDVVGNPQQVDGMKQRVYDGDAWVEIGTPTIRFETDDGHNHFHLIEAIEYVLWNELQGAQTAIGSKVGFCLVDSEQMEPVSEQAYTEDGDKFCQEDNPEATELRMGISPGWRDIYDATTTLQWVDVSNVAPGRYWIGAITDPNDEIVESNEDNNGLIFSNRTIAIPGFAPRAQPPVVVEDPWVAVTLTASTHGTVTQPIYVIEQGPTQGTLDVPLGADLASPVLRYYPDPSAEGTDRIVFSVHDAASPYPFDRPTQTIDFDIVAGGVPPLDETATADGLDRITAPSLLPPSTFFETTVGDRSTVEVEVSDAIGDPARLFAVGLPSGLVANAGAGTITGVATEEGIFTVSLVAIGATPLETTTLDVTWIVNPGDGGGEIGGVPDQSSPRGALTRLQIGPNSFGAVYEADGLPDGLSLDARAPVISGSPTEVGTSTVTVRQLDDGEVVAESTFEWVVRPTTDIEFAL